MQDIDKRSMICGMFMSSTVETSAFIEKLLRQFAFHQIYSENITSKQMFEMSEELILEQSDEIFGVSQISWESSLWKQLSLDNDDEVISLSHAKVYVFSDSALSWKGESEPNITCCLGRMISVVQRFITIQNFGHN